jgi:hypothetical protein
LLKERLPSNYVLQPHLSLIYHTLPEEFRRDIARDIVVPFEEVTFAAVQAVVAPAETINAEDVLRWKLVEQRVLT